MDTTTAPAILAEQFRSRGLTVINADDQTVSVMNPLNPSLTEAVGVCDGHYVTCWGYELGQTGDERGTAQRLAFLLALPGDSRSRDTATRR
ncbi:hypothetical protein [Streptomyces yerevanensis]|uniref:hypothetical protein n=1 Tax=Streptomyces yerevanensis TaxID=66378 RepID=UPI0005241D5F|nr:hypothetical protein [Streptomyces yerevanensis]